MREYLKQKRKRIRLNEGDKVRKKHKIGPLDKGYYPNWTDKTETVNKVIKGSIKPYVVLSAFDRRFYPEEFQKIKENTYRVERIIKKRKRNSKTELLIKWLGYPDSYNSWEPAENIRQKITGEHKDYRLSTGITGI